MHEFKLTPPAFGESAISDLVPSLLQNRNGQSNLFCDETLASSAVVLLCLDGLGWQQLQQHSHLVPTLMSMQQQRITTVAPSTTSTALTSLVTGTPPGQHGVMGYRIFVDGEVLNVLRWRTANGDARKRIPPQSIQLETPFCGQRPVVVQNAEFVNTGFTEAHLPSVRHRGWHTVAAIAVRIRQALAAGESFVYAYYDGIDKTAHIFGFDEFYEAELRACDNLVAEIMMSLPRNATLIVSADHGLVDCGGTETPVVSEVTRLCQTQSGEARFLWLHSRLGCQRELIATAKEAHADRAWVWSRQELIDEGIFGDNVTKVARSRLGDVALVAKDRWYFTTRHDRPKTKLIGRHGSMTAAEMFIPILTFTN